MQRSTERILTTHTGSLPRPDDLVTMIYAGERGEAVDQRSLDAKVREAVAEVVAKQRAAGIDVINDGEQSKTSYATYVKHRLTGFEGTPGTPAAPPLDDFPEYAKRLAQQRAGLAIIRPACNGPIRYHNTAALQQDLDNFRAGLGDTPVTEAFLSAASPGIVAHFIENQYYRTQDEYLFAVADAMKTEYDAIVAAGFVLQLDCPDLAMSRSNRFRDKSIEEFRQIVARHIEALNWATRDIPADRMRMHLCWGNYEGPHHLDVPLIDIVDLVLTARPSAVSFEAANPRHGHEWAIWRDVQLPEGKAIIPGILDSTTNFVEHPDLIAQNIIRYAELVGRENVLAGSDCGFSTGAGYITVEPGITWLKLAALAEGARRASEKLW